MFINCNMNHEIIKVQSKNHNIGTYRINKVYLSCYNESKHILEDGYHRLSHFQKSTC